eukprot:g5427.t1
MIMTLGVLALLLSSGCITEDDCSLAGACIAGRCVCRAPFAGPSCARLAAGVSSPAYVNASSWAWGGSPIEGPDGTFHLFASQLTNDCGLLHYQTNSEVAHLVAARAEGPYRFRATALARRLGHWDAGTVHGPTVRYDPSSQLYVLFYMSTNFTRSSPRCYGNASYPPVMVSASRRIGVAWSSSLDGPWERADAPILAPSRDPAAWDSGDVSNPAPAIAQDGSVLLAYRAGGDGVAVGGGIGMAAAPSFRGPYTRVNRSMLFAAEDAVLWREPEPAAHWHMLVHAFQGVGGRAADNVGGHAWSRDGLRWQYASEAAYTLTVAWPNGSVGALYRRERPQLLFDSRGKPVRLFNGVQPAYPVAQLGQFCDFGPQCKTFTMTTAFA